MKNTLNLSILVLVLFSRIAIAQIASAALDQDPVFTQVVTHRIHYPVKPASHAIYGRFYAGFDIDSAGHIRNISVLYPKMSTRMNKLYGFEYEIHSGLKHMPPLKPNLAGSYILPIAFCYTHYREGASPIVPTNVLPKGYQMSDRVLLSEVKVFASSPSSTLQLNGFPASKQIGQ
ncbi:hypothetical protein [Spirosoma radiotolerans]|uniref:TonB C-terminal domain-containing protein n=1 Tax=Spirosoma radiotolerans TaxID=1379870 RepID=A0A0E3ZV46_9BACT|nr:hypothetical protein [Spirosoma radiotolerans]AKD54895.1 hypothetical protein SD10_08270 [Spirosoma radiotolerans]